MVIGEVNDYLKIFVLMINFIVNRLKTKKKHNYSRIPRFRLGGVLSLFKLLHLQYG